MRKYLVYLIAYSIAGYMLERVINILFLGEWVDNSVLWGPIQPMYGLGVVLTLFIYKNFIKRLTKGFFLKNILLLITAVATTAISEGISGTLYESLTGSILWDYNDTFTCPGTYVCILPTTLFGIISFFTVKYFHPFIDLSVELIPKTLQRIFILLFIVNIVYTIIRIIQ